MILSHNEYAHLCHNILTHNDIRSGHYSGFEKEFRVNSWIDYLLAGNVFVLGLSLDFSEFDLWWLLTRRQREIGEALGNVVFYEQASEKNRFKHAALSGIGVTVRTLGCKGEDYIAFYKKAIIDIEKTLGE